MNKTAAALALVVCIAVATTAVVYVVKIRQQEEAQIGDEFDSVDDLLSDLDDFLNFENQQFDDDLSEILGDWG